MKIFKNKFYLLESVPGISGFQQWNCREQFLCMGYKAANNRTQVVSEFRTEHFSRTQMCEARDGHLPGYCPQMPLAKAFDWLRKNPFSLVYLGTRTV